MGSYYFHEYNWIQAEREKRKAVTLNPGGGEEKFNLASFLAQFGHTEEALALDREALKLDPLDDRAQIKYIRDLYYAKKWEEAIKRCEALISENRALNGAYQFMYISYADMGQLEKAGDALSKLMELTNQDQIAFIFGNNDFKTAVLKMFEHDASAHFQLLRNPMHRAVFYAYIEDRENTLKYLNESYNNREPMISFIRGARFDFIREDPRFEALYRMAGFKTYDDYQLDKGRLSASL
jgi:tetratricopeptide (TPR) repeat protein